MKSDWRVEIDQYPNGQPRMQLFHAIGVASTASMCLPEIGLEPGEILVRNYPGEELLEALLSARLVLPLQPLRTGLAVAEKCQLLE